MVGKIFLVLSTLTFLSPVCPSPLTKDITAEQSPQLKFRDILAQLERTDVLGEAVGLIFNNVENIYSNLTGLLQSKNKPDISEVLDIFNFAFGVRVLIVDDEKYIRVEPNAFEELLSDKVRSAVKMIFPNDYLQQVFVYSILQKHIHSTIQEILPEIDSRKVSLDEINSRVTLGLPNLATRAADLVAALEATICDTLVATAFSQLNDTFTTTTNFLNSITISISDNALVSIAENLVSYGINIARQAVAAIWQLAESFESSICSNLLSSRKRRDLTFSSDLVDRSVRDPALAGIESQVIGTRSIAIITAVLWSILSTILSYALASLVNSIIMSLTSFLINTVAEWSYSLIDSIF